MSMTSIHAVKAILATVLLGLCLQASAGEQSRPRSVGAVRVGLARHSLRAHGVSASWIVGQGSLPV